MHFRKFFTTLLKEIFSNCEIFDHMHPMLKKTWGHFSQKIFTVRWRYFNRGDRGIAGHFFS